MRIGLPLVILLALGACDEAALSGDTAPKGPPIEITEAARLLDRTRVVMRYKNGGEIASDDELRAVQKGAGIACNEGESPIVDTRTREGGLFTATYFCVAVTTTDEVIDGTGLRT